jgi:hypothetical protein
MDSIKQLYENKVRVEGDWRRSAQLWMHSQAVTQPRPGEINIGKGLTYHPTYAVMTNLPPKRLICPNLPPN